MNIFFKLLIITILMLSSLFANQNTIRIAMPKHLIPYSFIDENNKPKGMLVDYWKLWSKKTKIKIEFIPSTWKDSIEAVKSKTAHIHIGMFYSKEREKHLIYLNKNFEAKLYLYIHKQNNEIRKVEDLRGKKVGVIEDTLYKKILDKNFSELKIIKYATSKKLLKAFENKKVSSILINELLIWQHYIKILKLTEFNQVNKLDDFYIKDFFRVAINKNFKNLENIISNGLNEITKKEITKIENKWNLSYKFTKNNSKVKVKVQNSILTKKELAYIKNAPTIKVGTHNWGQALILKNNGEISGLVGDILKKVSKVSGLKFISHNDTWPNLINKLKKKEIDLIPTAFYEKSREEFGLYSQSYLTVKEFVFIKNDNSSIKSIEDLSNKRVAIIKGFSSIKLLKKSFPKIKIIEVVDLEESILKLVNSEVDAIYETHISMEQKLKELLISNVKVIPQAKYKANLVHLLSKKDDFLLQSILNKSLSTITQSERNSIINKWIGTSWLKKPITLALTKEREPYTLDSEFIKGIEYDLIKRVLDKSNISIKEVKYIPKSKIPTYLKDDKSIDIVSGVKKRDDNFFYSDDFISFQNVVISRKKDNFTINKIDDLKNKSIIAFTGASKYLGSEYSKLFNKNNRTPLYKEFNLQNMQVQDFLDKKSDLIILDKDIFIWYMKKLSLQKLEDFKFDFIFRGKNTFQVGFKDMRRRDIFNINLKIIKNNGEFEDVFFNYLQSDIKSKIKINQLLAALLSKHLYENNIKEAKQIIDIFQNFLYIKKIELFNTKNELLYSSSLKESKNFLAQNIFHFSFGTPKNSGLLKVYFNEKELKKYYTNLKLIPNINLFKDLNSYTNIKKVYKSFNYFDKKIFLTKKEKLFIKKHPNITYSTLRWEPISILEKDELIGLMGDYIKIIEKETGLNFVYQKSDSWKEIKKKFKEKKIDLIPKVSVLNNDKLNYLESNEITNFRFAIVTKEKGVYADKIEDLSDKVLALPEGFPNYNFIKTNYPNIKIKKAKDMKEALSFVSKGEAYAFVAFSEVSIYNVKKYFPQLKIAGVTNDKFIHDFLIQKEYPELLSIINKVLANISYKQKQDIRDKWIDQKVNIATDYRLVYQLITIFIIILVIISFFISKLKKTNEKMQEQKRKFEALFSDTSDAVILSKDGKYIDANNATISLFNYKNKANFLNMSVGSIAPKFQDDGELSSKKMKRYLKQSYIDDTVRFQWQSKKFTGEIFWIEIVITKLNYDNKDILHMLCRDINDKKLLEQEVEKKANELEKTNEKLELQKNLFESLFEGSYDSLLIIEDSKIVDCNKTSLKLFKIKDKETMYTLKPGSMAPKYQPSGELSQEIFKREFEKCNKLGYTNYERVLSTSLEENFWASIILINLKINNRNIIYSIIRDISDKRSLEEQILSRSSELENSNKELQITIENLEKAQKQLIASEKMASLGGLVAGVAHEINTPVGIGLTGISHFDKITNNINSKYSKEEMTQEDFEEYLKTSKDLGSLIHKNLEKAASLVNSFKQVAVDQSSEEKRSFNLYYYIKEILVSINSATKKANISIDCPRDITIKSYPGAYSQIITNLIMNSIIHGFSETKSGNINISFIKDNNSIKIIYNDNGKGINKENLNKIFDPFFTTNRESGGSGLGLNIIYNIITSKLNGEITCSSTVDKGAEFRILLKI